MSKKKCHNCDNAVASHRGNVEKLFFLVLHSIHRTDTENKPKKTTKIFQCMKQFKNRHSSSPTSDPLSRSPLAGLNTNVFTNGKRKKDSSLSDCGARKTNAF